LEFTPLEQPRALGRVPRIHPFAEAQREAQPEQQTELI
jgi:hypothetical protein